MRRLLITAAVFALSAPAAEAQLGGLTGRLGGALGSLTQAPGRLAPPLTGGLDPQSLLSLRLDRLDALVRAHPREIERDNRGAPVVRGEVLAVALSTDALSRARQAGFQVKPEAEVEDGFGLVVLLAPPGVSARDAVARLRRLDPAGVYDFNHLYQPSGETGEPVADPSSPVDDHRPKGIRLGLIDTGIDRTSAALAHVALEQRAFTGTDVKPAAHGTAVASLMVGDAPPFVGAAAGGALFAADVYGGAAAGGAADQLVRALFWLASKKVAAINISLVGPPNAILGAAIKAVQARGVLVVAAVGNDGPAAPPAYPASYRGVVAVTGVDGRGRVLIESGRAEHLDFAAPGADMAASASGGGYVTVRGTSFAAPIVTGRLSVLMAERGLSPAAAMAVAASEGKPGAAYGRALIGLQFRTPPEVVRAAPSRSD